MGNQSTHWQSEFSDFEGGQSVSGDYAFDVFRADLDAVLSYRALENVRLFAGYKYLYMKVDFKYTELRTDDTSNNEIDEINLSSDSYNSYFHGPALGVGYAHPFSQYYFAAITVSGVYMWGNFSMNNSTGHNWSGITYSGPRKNDMADTSMRQIGLNVEPSIGFSPGKGMPIITLGFRYQRFWVQFTDNTSGQDHLPSKWLDDTMLGIFMSVVFMF